MSMNKIANWVFGSFFRTIGRLLVFVLLGFIISRLVDFGSLIDNFRITDLFFEKVNASTMTSFYSNWYNDNGNQMSQMGDFGYIQYQGNSNYTNWWNFYYNSDKSGYNAFSNFDYIEITTDFSIYATSSTSTTLSETDAFTCQLNHSTIDQAGGYNNNSFTCNSIGVSSDTYENILNVAINPRIMYGNGSWNTCNFKTCVGSTCTLVCNLNPSFKTSGLRGFAFNINTYNINLQSGSYIYRMSLTRPFTAYKGQDTLIEDNTNAINNQSQQQQQQHNETINTITDDTSPNVNGTMDSDTLVGYLPAGPIDSVLNLPLAIMNNLVSKLSGTCSPLSFTLPFLNKTMLIPCIDTIFSNIPGLNLGLNGVFGIIAGLMLYNYLVYLYNWVDDITSLKHARPRLFGAKSDAENWGDS